MARGENGARTHPVPAPSPRSDSADGRQGEDRGCGRRVLLVGINYAPEETGIAPYTTDLAEHLVAAGWKVTVLAGMPHYPHWTVSPDYRRALRRREHRNGVELHRFRHYVPASQSALRRGMYEASFLVHASTDTASPRPDCVVGIVPSLSGGVVAALQARRHRAPLGLIIQDLLSPAAAQSGLPGAAAMSRPVRAIEGALARQAAVISIITETFRPYLVGLGVDPERVIHVPNWTHVGPPSARAGDMRKALGWPDDVRVVLHAGNMGYKQGLDNVVGAARFSEAEGQPLHFVLMGDGSERKRLEVLARGVSRLEFLEPQPREVFMDVLAAADVLLLNERASVRDMSLPGKITSYFRSGRPVVAAVRPDGATAAELRRSGGAILVPPEDPARLVDSLCRLTACPERCEALVAAATEYAETNLGRTSLLSRAEDFVASLVDRHPSGVAEATTARE